MPRPALAQPSAGLTGRLDWVSDDWTAPDGSRYHVAGIGPWIGLAGRLPGAIAWRLEAADTPLMRTDTQEWLDRVGGRLDLGLLWGAWHLKPATKAYGAQWGVGLLADGQWHRTSAPVQGRARDYLDESQLRVGPSALMRLRWQHPTDPAWHAHLTLRAAPYLVGITTGGVPFPHTWSHVSLRFGPSWRHGAATLAGGVEGELWYGEGFVQRAGGLFAQAAYGF